MKRKIRWTAVLIGMGMACSGLPAMAQQTISGTIIRSGTTPLTALSQSGAATNQIPYWNGTSWTPSTLAAGTGLSLNVSGGTFTVSLAMPTLTTLGGVEANSPVLHEWVNSINTSGVPQLSQPAFTDIWGTINVAQLPYLSRDVYGPYNATTVEGIQGNPVTSGAPTSGDLLIGTSSGGWTPATLTAGSNVTITNGSGSITVSASGGGGGGNPTINSVAGSGSAYSLTQSYANTGIAPITLTSGDTYLLSATAEVNDMTSAEDLRLFLYDSTAGCMVPWSEARAYSGLAFSGGPSGVYRQPLTASAIYTAPGNDTIQLWGCDVKSASDATITSYRTKLSAMQVSGSSAATQQSLPSLPVTPVSWYKPSSLSGSSGSNVTSWTDSGSAGLNATASSSYPTLVTNAWNGLDAVSWGSSSVTLNTASLPSSSTTFDLFVVVRAYTGTISTLIAHVQGTGASNGYQINSTTTAYQIEAVYQSSGGGWGTTTTTGLVPNNGWYVLELQRTSGGSSTLYINGTSEATSSVSIIAPTGVLGIGGPAASGTTMEIGEVILFNSALSTANQAAVNAYLDSEWGI